MRRQRQTPAQEVLDLSIQGDDLERDRIQLEHNLQHTNLSLELSGGSHDAFGNESIEMPRHNSINAQYSDFDSFIRKGDVDDGDPHNHWSYRTGDDEEGISPYGNTISTAAHHASALTLSAGLGRRGGRRDRSLSGAEYDPDRPLKDMMANADSKLSMFDMDPSRSRYQPPTALSLGPLIVDDTTELDRVLQSGHALPLAHSRSVRLRSPHSSRTSAAGSDSETSFSGGRPKLSDALRSVSFSPKRPRGGSPRTRSAPLPHSSAQVDPARVSSPLSRHIDEQDVATPRPTKRSNLAPNRSNSTPAVRVHPATPAISKGPSSKLRQAELVNETADKTMKKPAIVEDDGNPFNDVVNKFAQATISTSKRAAATPFPGGLSKSRIHLPDVTGLTNAVDSPAKGILNRQPFGGDAQSRETEAQLRAVLVAVQTKLQSLEDENSISRRRMRELENELELCRKEVARERTRILEQENLSFHPSPRRRDKGKGRARDRSNVSMDRADVSFRFKEVIEEKKALEALIDSLRSHLTRLTSELSSHRQLLHELREMRESDARALREKSAEVHLLRSEVERLAGEVVVLRGVVEDGLEQRRAAREASAASADMESDEDEEEEEDEELESDVEPFDPQSIPGSSRDQTALPERTMRTDRATIETPKSNQVPSSRPRFIDDAEFSRISAEIRERRSEHSAGGSTIGSPSQLQSYFNSGEHDREDETRASIPPPLQHTESSINAGVASRDLEPTEMDIDPQHFVEAGPSRNYHDYEEPPRAPQRPAAPTPGHARMKSRPVEAPEQSFVHDMDDDDQHGAPFPKIRGARMERLFFSSEHHPEKCTMCRRRRVRPGGAQASDDGRPLSPSWLPSRMGRQGRKARVGEDEDEGFEEGSEVMEEDQGGYAKRRKMPPQSALVSVIKEMEDDFAHYKHVYIELADQYKIMDAASDVPKRNLIAAHLREVIDIIEQKGDQIASLYDLLEKDKALR